MDCNINVYRLSINDEKTGQRIDIKGDYINAKIKKNDIYAKTHGIITSKNEEAKVDLDIQLPMPDNKT